MKQCGQDWGASREREDTLGGALKLPASGSSRLPSGLGIYREDPRTKQIVILMAVVYTEIGQKIDVRAALRALFCIAPVKTLALSHFPISWLGCSQVLMANSEGSSGGERIQRWDTTRMWEGPPSAPECLRTDHFLMPCAVTSHHVTRYRGWFPYVHWRT